MSNEFEGLFVKVQKAIYELNQVQDNIDKGEDPTKINTNRVQPMTRLRNKKEVETIKDSPECQKIIDIVNDAFR